MLIVAFACVSNTREMRPEREVWMHHFSPHAGQGNGVIEVTPAWESEDFVLTLGLIYRGADKSLARPGRKQAIATEDFDFHISYL